jgi:hypothetical protein
MRDVLVALIVGILICFQCRIVMAPIAPTPFALLTRLRIVRGAPKSIRSPAPKLLDFRLSATRQLGNCPQLTPAAAALARSPEKSDRAIAKEIGVSDKTVAKARRSTADHSAVAPVDTRVGQLEMTFQLIPASVGNPGRRQRLRALGRTANYDSPSRFGLYLSIHSLRLKSLGMRAK